MMPGVQTKELSYTIGGTRLLKSITLEAQRGTLCAIVGPSGAGKSTLLKSMCGIKQPSVGRALLAGQDVRRLTRAPELFGYVPQDDIVHRELKVERVLHFAAELRLAGRSPARRRARVEEVLELVGLAPRRKLRVGRLSGGQRKRVSIGVELITAPQVLFLDEPTSGLDPGLERQLMQTLRGLSRDDRTIVVTTHTMESMDLVDQLVVVYDGYLAFAGPPARALELFHVEVLRDLFAQLKKRSPSSWSAAFERERARLSRPEERAQP